MKVFYVQFLLSKVCNKNCIYCDLKNKNYNQSKTIDLDYFKWCINELSKYTNKLMIEICGGEPGLIDNLKDVFVFLKSNKNVIKTQLMSNGLVRLKHFDVLEYVDSYNEHLIENIKNGVVKKFYDLEYIKKNNSKTVIVLNEDTTESLLNYKEDLIEFYNKDYFWLKPFVERTKPNNHINKMLEVLNSEFYNDRYLKPKLLDRKMCSLYPWLPSIDLEEKHIIHCAYHNFGKTIHYDVNSINIEKLVSKNLFKLNDVKYCKNCFGFSANPELLMQPKINRLDNN